MEDIVSAKSKSIAVGAAALAVFLVGFFPQFLEKRRLRTELAETQAWLSVAQRQTAIDELRRLAGRMLLEATRLNYGTAREHSTAYFNKLRELADKPDYASMNTSLRELLNSRDAITGGLAQANPSIISELQSLLERTYNLPDAENIRQ
jgi:hypothetical protein